MTTWFSQEATLKVGMVVGEASGDLLGAHLMSAILAQNPKAEFVGIGGPQMEALGFKSLYPQEKLAVRGLVEVLKRLPELMGIRKGVFKTLMQERPHVFVGVDAPDFNLALEAKFKQKGIPAIHYVSPSVWAWRSERVPKIARQVDHVLCLFPMEPPLYTAVGGKATFVGHPLAQTMPLMPDKVSMRQKMSIRQDIPVFTLMPGSRVSEIDYMAPLFLGAAKLIAEKLPQARFLVPLATVASTRRFKEVLSRTDSLDLPLTIMSGHAQMACVASDVVLVTSGTATLEVALCKRPMVISYRISGLTYAWVKGKIKSAYVGLPNILLNKPAVPELLQDDATPEKLARAMLDWYEDKAASRAVMADFTALHETLRLDTAKLAADVVIKEARR
ncbi:MAG: lipid-A-disaccharide synthase [Neisseriaceae bacterium]|nr:lipid-A-disaccharide synthase [Neisseriaceae bacterium]